MEVERVGSGAIVGSRARIEDTGYIPYAEVVESRTKKERRGLVSAKKAANLRRSDVLGSVEEKFDSCAEASGGITGSVPLFCAAASFKRFLRR